MSDGWRCFACGDVFQITYILYLIFNSKVQEWDGGWEEGFFPEPDFSHLLAISEKSVKEE